VGCDRVQRIWCREGLKVRASGTFESIGIYLRAVNMVGTAAMSSYFQEFMYRLFFHSLRASKTPTLNQPII